MAYLAAEFLNVEITPNPVAGGQSVIVKSDLHDFSHGYWSRFTRGELSGYTHKKLSGEIYLVHNDWAGYTHDELKAYTQDELNWIP